MAAMERSDFAAIAANRHGAPASAMSARAVIEEKAARGISATAHGRVGAFDDELCGGTRNGGKEPLEASFAGGEFQPPAFGAGNEFVMALGEAKQIVDGFGPAFGERLFLNAGVKDCAEGFAQAKHFEENGVNGLRLGLRQRMEASRAFGSDDAGVDEEGDEFVPGKVMRGGSGVGEI